MTLHQKLLIAAIVAASAIVPVASSNAQGISISVGDRPYYTHGPSYWSGGHHLYWVPGHWGRYHQWIPGHYVRRGHRDWHRHYGRGGVRIY